MIIRSRSPVRISFAGGGTDVSPYTEDHGGCVINAAINKYAYATLELRDDNKIHFKSSDYNKELTFGSINDMKYDGDLDLFKSVVKHYKKSGINLSLRVEAPPRSGLGSSGSAFASLIGLFNHLKREHALTDYEIAELAYDLERKELKNPGGRQDQYVTVFGGINFIEFKGNDFVRVNPLKLSKNTIYELEKNLVIVNVGIRKQSGDIISDQTKRYKENKEEVIRALQKNKEFAIEMKKALLRNDLNSFGKLLHNAWEEKKKYSSMISNDRIDNFYNKAKAAGAIGGKVSGAGGGGHMLFYCKPNTEITVANVLEKLGAKIVPFTFDFKGLQTWEVQI
jgi:D-glycero-alpha-D-manno-heptose-7-phosphate kinase